MSLHWFACYPNDLLGSLRWRSMTPEQRGAYWQLICLQMQSADGTLPDDIGMLGRLAELPLEGANACIADAFPVVEPGKRANKRAMTEWLKRVDISQKRSNSGGKGAATKWQTDGNCHDDATILPPTITITSTGTATGTNAQEISVQPQAIAPRRDGVAFAEFWSIWIYNRKGKKDAEKAWAALGPDRELFATIKADLSTRMDRDPVWQKGMVMLPATYIRGARWQDELGSGPAKPPDQPVPPKPYTRPKTDMDYALELAAWEGGRAPEPEWHKQQRSR